MKISLKGLFLCVGLLLFLSACQPDQIDFVEEEILDTSVSNFEVSSRQVSLKEYSQNKKLVGEVSRIMKNKGGNRSSEDGSLSVFENQVLYIEAIDYHSYTFKVDKEEELPLQNVTFSLNDTGDYDSFLITYDINQEELDALDDGVVLDLRDKTIIEDIDLDSDDFFNRSSSRSRCSDTVIESCVTKQTCDFGGDTHCAGDACIANGNANDPHTVCTPISVISNCADSSNGDQNNNDNNTSDGGGGGGTDSQVDPDDPTEEIVPCDTLPPGEGIDIGNGMCIVGTGLTGPLSKFEPTAEDIRILHINGLIEPNLNQAQEEFLRDNDEFAVAVLDALINGSESDEMAILELLNFGAERDWKQALREAIANGITTTAELVHTIYNRLSSIAEEYPSSIGYINVLVDGFRDAIDDLIDTNPASSTWVDLFNMWLFEKGANPILFNGSSVSTETLVIQEGVNEAREIAIERIENNDLDGSPVSHQWMYGQEEFYDGITTGNLETAFLGTYRVDIIITETIGGNFQLQFSVSNTSSWESATRFRIDNDGNGAHDGIFDNKPRGEGIHLGGNFIQEWSWTETFIPN